MTSPPFRDLLLVLGGGAVGSVGRWLLARWLDRWAVLTTLPVGILVVNGLGCLLIGVVLGTTARGQPLAGADARLLLATGVCGGFTTFSTFAYQTLGLMQEGRPGAALAYVAVSVGGGLLATAGGLALVRAVG